MKADATPLLKFIKDNQKNQLVIPIYQRVYSWEKEQCKELWDDITKIGGNDKMDGHFIGSILYVLDGFTHSDNTLLIIDGRWPTKTHHYHAFTHRFEGSLER
ncbi:hypothetical protein JP0474_03400 [Helicobacter pylori]|nr:hypothetical protein JP0521_03920 [Helicobacter pylori]